MLAVKVVIMLFSIIFDILIAVYAMQIKVKNDFKYIILTGVSILINLILAIITVIVL